MHEDWDDCVRLPYYSSYLWSCWLHSLWNHVDNQHVGELFVLQDKTDRGRRKKLKILREGSLALAFWFSCCGSGLKCLQSAIVAPQS